MTLDLTGYSKKNIFNKSKFEKTALKFEKSARANYTEVNYNPVFRSSGIFFVYFIKNKIDTNISFLNYFQIKNYNKNISCLISLRDSKGFLIKRNYSERLDVIKNIKLSEFLDKNVKNFYGTIEVEFFSTKDLKYSFPALDVFYFNKDSLACVHTNQRVFNNIQDQFNTLALNDLQTGFDIYSDRKYFSILTMINGPLELKNIQALIEFYNKDGLKKIHKLNFKKINPYETILVNLKNIKFLKNFLNNEKGFCKIKSPTKNVFNRIMIASFSQNMKHLSVTHSYYDCSQTKDYLKFNQKKNREYACYLPFNMIKDINLDLVFYPIYSKVNLDLNFIEYDKSKKIIRHINQYSSVSKNFKTIQNISINKVFKNKINPENLYLLYFSSSDNKYPSRLTFGMNYYKDKNLGTNISSSILLNFGKSYKRRGYFWGPCLFGNKLNSYLMISHFSNSENTNEKTSIKINIFDDRKKIVSKSIASISPNAININLSNMIERQINKNINNKSFNFYWFTVETSSTSLICNHVHLSKNGLVAGDHSF